MSEEKKHEENPRELDIISYLSNPQVRTSVKSLIPQLMVSSNLALDLREYYQALPNSYAPEDGALIAFLQNAKHSYTEKECSLALTKKAKYAHMSDQGAITLVDAFINYFRDAKILGATERFFIEKGKDSKLAKENLIESIVDLNSLNRTHFVMDNLNDLDLESVLNEELGVENGLIQSTSAAVAQSSAYNAYIKGMLVQVNAPPGVGKTLWTMYEIVDMTLNQNLKVAWIALGDMMRSDFIIRMTSIVTRVPYSTVTLDPLKYVNDDVRKVFHNLRLNVQPASSMTASEAINNLLAVKEDFDFDVFVIDYDDNLKPETDNLFQDGGNTYAELTRLTRLKDNFTLGFVLSQVKQHLWEEEELPENCSSSSSRKQAVIDMQVNINRNKNVKNIGTINIAKQRRGDLIKMKYEKMDYGEFREISRNEYQSLQSSYQ